ncbi:unnamed protein product [Camellia sinensis]
MALDHVIAEARQHGVRLLLSLVNNLQAYGGKTQYVKWAWEEGIGLNSLNDSFFFDPSIRHYFKNHVKKLAAIQGVLPSQKDHLKELCLRRRSLGLVLPENEPMQDIGRALLGADVDVPVYAVVTGVKPAEIARQGLEEAKRKNMDVVIVDTAGRLQLWGKGDCLLVGLRRSGKSCRMRWMNYLRPNLKHGRLSAEEERIILQLHKQWGNKWSKIARRLPGRTDNEIKNYWRRVNYALGALYYLCNGSNKEEILKPEVVDVIRRYAAAGAVSMPDCCSLNELPAEPSEIMGSSGTPNEQQLPGACNVAFNSLPTIHINEQIAPQEVRSMQNQLLFSSDSGGRMLLKSYPKTIACEESMGLYASKDFLMSQQTCHQRKYFAPHWSVESVNEALEKGNVFKALFRVNAHNRLEAYCKINGVQTDVLISGIAAQNRAYCYFTLKAWNAQNAGAAALLVVNDRVEPLITMDTPEEEDTAPDYQRRLWAQM